MTHKRVVLITGCSSGFGFGMALRFARAGDRVYAGVKNPKSKGSIELSRISRAEHLALTVLTHDVTSDPETARAVERILREAGRIDILINNAGFGSLGPIEAYTIDEVRELYETNIFGVIRMAKAVAPVMRKQKSGLIVNFSSINGIVPFPLFSMYSSTKFAIETITEGLRFELGHFGIRVVLIEPGSYATHFSKNRKEPLSVKGQLPYRTLVDHFRARYDKMHDPRRSGLVSKTADPAEVVERVHDIASQPEPALRNLVGGDARLYYWIRKILPSSIWEWLLRNVYRW